MGRTYQGLGPGAHRGHNSLTVGRNCELRGYGKKVTTAIFFSWVTWRQ